VEAQGCAGAEAVNLAGTDDDPERLLKLTRGDFTRPSRERAVAFSLLAREPAFVGNTSAPQTLLLQGSRQGTLSPA
jgi:hypothetical protein